MADPFQLTLLKKSVEEWNRWREEYTDVPIDLSYAHLSGADLSGADLSYARLSEVKLPFTDFVRAKLTNEARLPFIDFIRAKLISKQLAQSLYGYAFIKLSSTGANLSNADLSNTDLRRAKLAGARLTQADLSSTNLSNADLNEARLGEVNLSSANLNNANLTGASVSKANLNNASLVEANLSNADLSNTDLSNADLRRANLAEAYLIEANLSFADLNNANLNRTNLSSANLNSVSLIEADLSFANLSGVDLNRANLRRANLNFTVLSNANFSRVNLTQTKREEYPPGTDFYFAPKWIDVVTYIEGGNRFVAVATLASIIEGVDVIERRLIEQKERGQDTSSGSPASSKISSAGSEISEIILLMDDGSSQHRFKPSASDSNSLRVSLDAFNDPSSKVKPLHVIFQKREGLALMINVAEDGKDNPPLNVILSYLEADSQ